MSRHSETSYQYKIRRRARRAGACAGTAEPENGRLHKGKGAGRSWARRRAPCSTASCAAAAAHVAPHLPPRPRGTRRAAGCAVQWWRCVPMSTRAVAWHDGRFQTGGTSAQRSQRARSSRPAGAISACHAAAAWLGEAHWVKRMRRPTCTEPAINACPAQRSSGTSSRFGAGMGVRQRAGE